MAPAFLIYVPFVLQALQPPAEAGRCRPEVLTPLTMEEYAVAEFDASVDRYVALHRHIDGALPPEQMFDDAEEMYAARERRRSLILAARPGVGQGNVFTPGVDQAFIDALAFAIAECAHDPADILADINAERLPDTPEPRVNGRYPWGLASAMWPTLLRVLPPLPEELEYRFSNRDLVLIDVHANIVVDILENALPAPGCGVDRPQTPGTPSAQPLGSGRR